MTFTTETFAAYVDLDTGEVLGLLLDASPYEADGLREIYEKSRAEYESCRSLLLPRPDSSDEHQITEGFAGGQEGVAKERLQRALSGRGAFKRFKNEVAKLGLEQKWYEYREECYRDMARDLLDANGVRWI